MIDTFHRFFFFLSTPGGELLKNSVELLVFTILAYMVLSEYFRSKESELKLFSISFLCFMAHRAMITFLYFLVVFKGYNLSPLEKYMPFIIHSDIFALLLLVNAFIYPFFIEREKRLKYYTVIGLSLMALFFLIASLMWAGVWQADTTLIFRSHWFNTVFMIIQALILIFPFYYIPMMRSKSMVLYGKNILLGFAVYLVNPLLHLVNIVLYDNFAVRLTLVEQPFPLLAILLFTRIIYLKLANKAKLLDKLRSTEHKYKKEKEISEMKDEFISVVSHELRTPLTSVKLYLSLLKDRHFGGINKKQKDAIITIENETSRLNGMINNILDLSRLEADRVKLNTKKVNLNELVLDFYFKEAEEKGLKIIKKVPKNFFVRVDPEQFKQVLINLVNNATKFTDKGRITVSAKKLDSEWELIVEDTGSGIEKEKIPKLFDKFYQTEDHMTRTQKGSGLGLAIVKKIVELHNGNIRVESEFGKYSRFIVSLPNSV